MTGNAFIDEFLADYDRRMSDADTTTPAASKANLRKMRPAVRLLAQNDPEACQKFICEWMATHLPPKTT